MNYMISGVILFLSATGAWAANTVVFHETFDGYGPIEGRTAETNLGDPAATWVTVNSEAQEQDLNWIVEDGALTWNDEEGALPNTFSNRNYIPVDFSAEDSFTFTARAVPGAQQTGLYGLARASSYLSQAKNLGFAIVLLSGDAQFNYFDGSGEKALGRQSLDGTRSDEIEMRIVYKRGKVTAEAENLSTGTTVVLVEDLPVTGWNPPQDLQFVQWQSNLPTDDISVFPLPRLNEVKVSVGD